MSSIPAPYRLTPTEFVHEFSAELTRIAPLLFGCDYTSVSDIASAANALLTDTHGKLSRDLSDDERDAIRPSLRRMGYFDRLDLEPQHYREVHTTGMKRAAMVDSFRHLEEQAALPGVSFGRIVFKSGMRPQRDGIDGTLADLYAQLYAMPSEHPLVQQLLKTGLHHEFDLALLAALEATNGTVELVADSIEEADYSLEPSMVRIHRSMASCQLLLPSGTKVLMVNAPAVPDDSKQEGYHPPTAISTTEHYAAHYWDDSVTGGSFGLRNGMTHGRLSNDMKAVLLRQDPTLEFAATCRGADDETVKQRKLELNAAGELCRLIMAAA